MRCLTLGSAATGAISLRNGKPGMQCWACSGDGWVLVPSTSRGAREAWCWDGGRAADGVMLDLPGSPWVSLARSLRDAW